MMFACLFVCVCWLVCWFVFVCLLVCLFVYLLDCLLVCQFHDISGLLRLLSTCSSILEHQNFFDLFFAEAQNLIVGMHSSKVGQCFR